MTKQINIEALINSVKHLRSILDATSAALSSEPGLRSDVILGEAHYSLTLIEEYIQEYQANQNDDVLFKQLKDLILARCNRINYTYLQYSKQMDNPITHFFMGLVTDYYLDDVDILAIMRDDLSTYLNRPAYLNNQNQALQLAIQSLRSLATTIKKESQISDDNQELDPESQQPLERLLRQANIGGNQRADNLLILVDANIKATIISHMSTSVDYFVDVVDAYRVEAFADFFPMEKLRAILTAKNKNGDTPLLYAMKKYRDVAKEIILSHALEEDLLVRDKENRSLLMVELKNPDWRFGRSILEKSTNPQVLLEQIDDFENTVLHLAVEKANEDAAFSIARALDENSLINMLKKTNQKKETPLGLAFNNSKDETKNAIGQLLVRFAFNNREFTIEILEKFGEIAYSKSMYNYNLQTVIRRKVGDNDNSALMYAIMTRQFQAVAIIIEHLHENLLLEKNNDGDTALHFAVYQLDVKTVKSILDKQPLAYTQRNHKNEFPFLCAIRADSIAMVDAIFPTILKESSDLQLEIRDYLIYACMKGHSKILNHIVLNYPVAEVLLESYKNQYTLHSFIGMHQGGEVDLLSLLNVYKDDIALLSLILEEQKNQADLIALLSSQDKKKQLLLSSTYKDRYKEVRSSIRKWLTEGYLVNHSNPLIKMTMRFVQTQIWEGSRDEQLNHFLTLIKEFKRVEKDASAMDSVREAHPFNQKPLSKWLGKPELYQGLMDELNRTNVDNLPEIFQEFMNFNEIINAVLAINNAVKGENKILIRGTFNTMTKRYLDIATKVRNVTQLASSNQFEFGSSQ